MANGDIAATRGIALVPPTGPVKNGYDEINRALDVVVLQDQEREAAMLARVVPIAQGGTGQTAVPAGIHALRGVENDGAGNLRIGAIGGNRVRVINPGYVTDNTLAYVGDLTALSAELLPVIEALQALVATLEDRIAALEKKPK
jgi:hypothetical protein